MLTSPTLLLDKKIAAANLERMLSRAASNRLQFRPHFKTIQSRALGKMFREKGITAITVSSIHMAEYFAADGWDDITVAFPINVREWEAINRLAEKIDLNLIAVNEESIKILDRHLSQPVGIFIKIDVGTHRTGLLPDDHMAISSLVKSIDTSSSMTFRGFLSHAGHSYGSQSETEIIEVHESSTKILRKLKKEYSENYSNIIISTGDTPTCSVAETWEGIDEIRPGNFIFYDLMQVQIGSCQMKDVAVAMACPVVAKHPDRQEVIIHGGGIHLSKDRIFVGKKGLGLGLEGKIIFGVPVLLSKKEWAMPEVGNYVRSVSQEHGVISCSPSFFEKIKIGDMVGVLPVHSCMAVNLMDKLVTLDGEELDSI